MRMAAQNGLVLATLASLKRGDEIRATLLSDGKQEWIFAGH